jgi:ABC-type phosphate transport system auxiliary subunit
MAKALLGHLGTAPDMRLVAELRRLQRRVKELEAELEDVRSTQSLEHSLSLSDHEPALT